MMKKQDKRETKNQSKYTEPLGDLELITGQAEVTKGGARGGAGNVVVVGGAGNDTVRSGAGLDVLIGNTGSDRLID
jgi:Ca2+-binding RTX toxin-like protein